jgi:hypothetical protein
MTKAIDQIVNAFGDPKHPRHDKIPKAEVLAWMQSADIEVLGAIYRYLDNPLYSSRIEPSLSFDDVYRFILRYYERCFCENPTTSKWTNTRYEVGRDLVRWFNSMWQTVAVPRARLARIKHWLAELYKSGDDELRTCIVNATLEHLFEKPDIAEYFKDWQEDPLLAKAYADALLWSQEEGQ